MKAKRRTVLKSALLAGAAILSALLIDVASLGGLKDISKPYLGTYECEEIFLGGEDRSGDFEYLRIELSDGGKMMLYYREKDGKKGEAEGKYTYDREAKTITLYADFMGRELKRSFPLEGGEIDISARYGGKTLVMKFVRK